MSSSERALPVAESSRVPRTGPACCAALAVAMLMLAGVAMAAMTQTPTDAAGSRSNSADGQSRTPEQPAAPQPEAAPSAYSTPIGMDLPIIPAVAIPDTGADGQGGGGAIELALATTGGQDAAGRAHARGILATDTSAPAQKPSGGFDAMLLLPLGAGLVILGALLAVVAVRARGEDFDEPAPRHPFTPPRD